MIFTLVFSISTDSSKSIKFLIYSLHLNYTAALLT